MNGIEKITEKIVADARADAQKVMDAAYAESDEILSSATARARAVSALYDERLAKQREDADARANSASDTERRNANLAARANLIDRAFNEAHERLKSMSEDEYYAFLEKLLKSMLSDRVECDRSNAESNDEYDEIDAYELYLNSADRERFGEKLVAAAKDVTDKITLSKGSAEIDGGLVLRCGLIFLNASFDTLIAMARDKYEREVCDILYPSK